MNSKKLLSVLLCILMVCAVAVVPVEAAEVNENKTDTSTDTKTVTGRIRFNMGDWNHEHSNQISFYIWAKNVDSTDTKYGSTNGWVDNNNWGTKRTYGTPVEGEDGIIESYDIEFQDGWDYFVIFCDFQSGKQTHECVFTKDAIGKTAYLTGNMVGKRVYEVDFDDVPGCGSYLYITPSGNIIGHIKASNDDGAKIISEYIFDKMWQRDESGVECCTKEKVAKAISAYNTTPAAVWVQFQKIEGMEAKMDSARRLIFADITPGDIDSDGKVSAKDSMLIQRYVIKLKQLDDTQLKAADVNGDGKVTNKDALAILRFTIGFKVEGLS